MKKRLLLYSVTTLLPFLAYSDNFQVDGIYYGITDNKQATCCVSSGETPYSGDINIPATVSYNGKTYLVTKIGYEAFYQCRNLTSVTLPQSVTYIGGDAFRESGLKEITLSNSLQTIETQAFYCCSLTSVIIPNSVIEIGSNAFYGCGALTEITIPSSVMTIGGGAFAGNGITEINVDPQNRYFSSVDGVLFNKDQSQIIQFPLKRSGNFSIPNTVTTIGQRIFENCVGLTSITIPNSVTKIEDYAFYDCSGLTDIVIPNSVTFIGKSTFNGCTGLTDIVIPNSVTFIGNQAFARCSNLTSIIIPNSITELNYSVFSRCTGLTSVTIPNSVNKIGDSAFSACTSLTNIIIPNSVTSIGTSAFSACRSLTSVSIPNSVTRIQDKAFVNCSSLRTITIPNSVTSIGPKTFSGCSSLKSITYLAEDPLLCNNGVFDETTYQTTTLNYLETADDKIALTEPWSLFVNRVGRDADYIEDSSISEIHNSGNGVTGVYDLRGMKIGESTANLPRGVYIVKTAGKTRKITI